MNSTSDSANAYLLAHSRAIRELRAENAELLADNRALHRRCEALRAERDKAQRANRRRDWRGALCLMLWKIAGRDR